MVGRKNVALKECNVMPLSTGTSPVDEVQRSGPRNLEERVQYLERMEEQHSRLLVLKAKSDEEMFKDVTELRCNQQVLEGKVGYCMQLLEDSDSAGPMEGEEDGSQSASDHEVDDDC